MKLCSVDIGKLGKLLPDVTDFNTLFLEYVLELFPSNMSEETVYINPFSSGIFKFSNR
jgi:hypothetical protein